MTKESFFQLDLEVNAGAWSALGFYYRIANKSKIRTAYVGYFDAEDTSKALCSSRLIYYCKTPWMCASLIQQDSYALLRLLEQIDSATVPKISVRGGKLSMPLQWSAGEGT